MASPNAREFDKLVHHRDPKTGKIQRKTPYKMHVTKKGTLFYRDGDYYHSNGDPCKEPWKILDNLKKPEKKLSTEPKKKTLPVQEKSPEVVSEKGKALDGLVPEKRQS